MLNEVKHLGCAHMNVHEIGWWNRSSALDGFVKSA